jgi:hypothetical protein
VAVALQSLDDPGTGDDAPGPPPALPDERQLQRGGTNGRVLVLNASYEPINVCTVRRATVLVLKERAEVLEHASWSLHAESFTIARPVVIRLITYVRIPRDAHSRKITRRAVFARDGWACQYQARIADRRPRDPALEGRRVDVGQHRHLLRAVQPAQGGPAAQAGRHAPADGAEAAAGDDLRARGHAAGAGSVAAVLGGALGLWRLGI